MPFNLSFPAPTGPHQLTLQTGEMIFVLGANGSGKSSLLFLFNGQNHGNTRKISAHRQTWMNSDSLDMTPSAKVQTEQYIQNEDQNQVSRYRDSYAAQRASMTIYELIDAENVRARAMAAAYDAGEMTRLDEEAKTEAPITVINELLRQSNLPIEISIKANERVVASKGGGTEYSAAELSDGERNAVLIAGSVLTAPSGSLLIIDEPERHLHRSIISPLLGHLFERRVDCGFVISTHDHDLPLGIPKARTLLLRSCSFSGQIIQSWEADELPAGAPIDDFLKRELLGSRQKIVFVEGTENSLDKALYSVIFPDVSVIPKGTCYDVEHAVLGARSAEGLHWLQAFGIVDCDGFDADQVAAKQERGVYPLPFYSVEAIYFHPEIIDRIATRQASVSGDIGSQLAKSALTSGVAAVEGHTERLSQKAAKKAIRKAVMQQIPSDQDLLAGNDVQIVNNADTIRRTRKEELDSAVKRGNWERVIRACPVRECSALEDISTSLKFRTREDYQRAVRHLLTEDAEALRFVRGLFGDLAKQLT